MLCFPGFTRKGVFNCQMFEFILCNERTHRYFTAYSSVASKVWALKDMGQSLQVLKSHGNLHPTSLLPEPVSQFHEAPAS